LTLLDAYALIALLADEPAADEVEDLLREGNCRVVVVNLAEAADISQRVHGLTRDELQATLRPLFLGDVLSALRSEEGDAWRAAELRIRHYHRKDRPLSLADCFLLAHAAAGESLATADPPLAAAARTEGIEVIALPDRADSRP
jgi:predicted nucleic acid-binding protein